MCACCMYTFVRYIRVIYMHDPARTITSQASSFAKKTAGFCPSTSIAAEDLLLYANLNQVRFISRKDMCISKIQMVKIVHSVLYLCGK